MDLLEVVVEEVLEVVDLVEEVLEVVDLVEEVLEDLTQD